ncbi:MAG: ribonuclease D [Gammaproteobacteria bacterium]|nr:ribonuclease D [Gammaproteobacteria bacterium]
MQNTTDYSHDLYIDNEQTLQAFCQKIQDADVLAVDTEFVREKSYFSNLCLIQIATDSLVACIDPISIKNIDPLLDILYDTSKLKLMHAARQDLEIFYVLRGSLPSPIFDSQIAATVLGHGDQIGYSTLIENFSGIKLDKAHARTDWQQRPLQTAQLRYAADDVRFLIQIYPKIHEQLLKLGRLDWLTEDFDNLCQPKLYEVDEAKLWQRVSGHQRMKGKQLAILQQLAIWREQQAIQFNRPRKWILSDDLLIAMAKQAPSSPAELNNIRGIPPKVIEHHSETLLGLIQKGANTPREDWPTIKIVRTTADQDAQSDALMGLLRLKASENKISPMALGTRKEIEKIILGERDTPLLHGWRKELAGQTMLDMLDGRLCLQIEQGELKTRKV